MDLPDPDAPNATVVGRADLHAGLAILRVRPDREPIPDFEPGQFVQLGLPIAVGEGGESVQRLEKRSYSVASSPADKDAFEFLLALVPGGRLTPALWHLQVGARCWLDARPLGTFTLQGVSSEKDLVLVATGSGIAPYVSMLRTYGRGSPLTETGGDGRRWRRCTIIHGVRRQEDLAYREELIRQAADDPKMCYVPITSREPEPGRWAGLRGRVQAVLEGERCREIAGTPLDPAQCHVFLCGNPGMITDVRTMLEPRGFIARSPRRGGNLHHERYW